MTTLSEIYPVFGLRIRAGPLELSPIRDDDIVHLVRLAQGGIHDPALMPFAFPWTDAPAAELPIAMARHYWQSRFAFTPGEWGLELVVRRAGEVLGIQALHTKDYVVTRTAESGSWLGHRFQRAGIGTAMRQAVCAFAFDYLDALQITSGAFTDNPSSYGVSMKVGYRDNGSTVEKRREGESAVLRRLVLGPEDLVRGEYDLQVEGVAQFRRFIGLPD